MTDGVAWVADMPRAAPDGIMAVEPEDIGFARTPCALDRGPAELGVPEVAVLEPADCSATDGVACTAARLPAFGTAVTVPEDSAPCPPDPDAGFEEDGVAEPALFAPDDCSDIEGVLCAAVCAYPVPAASPTLASPIRKGLTKLDLMIIDSAGFF